MEKCSVVQLEASVVLKIIKHCTENSNAVGKLLGLDVDESLEVTGCFPLPKTKQTAYTTDMLRLITPSAFDNQVVGIYSTLNLEQHTVDSFMSLQAVEPNACLILFDVESSVNRLAFKAYRLSESALKARRFEYSELEELTVTIRNSSFVNSFLGSITPVINLKVETCIENTLHSLVSALETYSGSNNSVSEAKLKLQLNACLEALEDSKTQNNLADHVTNWTF